jgi:hypothetical protein
MLGKDQPVILQLLEIPDEKAQKALKGVIMELDDCAFPLLQEVTAHSDPRTAFKDADVALLVGARPRGPGMERKDLLSVNAQIFTAQGKALNDVASRNVKVLVVGNPANTNAYIAMKSAPDLPAKNFTAMLRLDHNRAASQLAAKAGFKVGDIRKLTVWGNHSPTMYADYRFATVNGESVKAKINDQAWNKDVFLPTVGRVGVSASSEEAWNPGSESRTGPLDLRVSPPRWSVVLPPVPTPPAPPRRAPVEAGFPAVDGASVEVVGRVLVLARGRPQGPGDGNSRPPWDAHVVHSVTCRIMRCSQGCAQNLWMTARSRGGPGGDAARLPRAATGGP